MTNENNIESVDDTTVNAQYFDTMNVKEFQVAKIAQKAKVIFYLKPVTYKDEQTGEEVTKKLEYIFVEIDGVVKPTRYNKLSQEVCARGFKTTSAKKMLGKEVIATYQKIGNNEFIVWKPQTKID